MDLMPCLCPELMLFNVKTILQMQNNCAVSHALFDSYLFTTERFTVYGTCGICNITIPEY